MLLGPAEQGRLTRPILCILVTDGEPSDGDLVRLNLLLCVEHV